MSTEEKLIVKPMIRLKQGIVSHKLECQQNIMSLTPTICEGTLNGKRKPVVDLSPCAKKQVNLSSKISSQEHINTANIKIEDTENPCDVSYSSSVPSTYKNELDFEVILDSHVIKLEVDHEEILDSIDIKNEIKDEEILDSNDVCYRSNSDIKVEADYASTSYSQPLESSETDTCSTISCFGTDLDSDEDDDFKNQMRQCMLTAIEKEPKMLLGLPKSSFYLIKLLSQNIPLPTIEIFITLKKIRLNESFSILGLQFGLAESAVKKIFLKSILILGRKMKSLIVWPKSREIFNNVPVSFRFRYSKVVSIIDCIEIQIEKPSKKNQQFQSICWSENKKCYTIKYLISCTLDGMINFTSDGYSGSANEIMIVEYCGFLDNLPPKTVVMTNKCIKGLSHLLEKKNCSLIKLPSDFDAQNSKRPATLYSNTVMNELQEFHMLKPHACVDSDLIPYLDYVMVVACGIINMQKGFGHK